MSKPRHDKLIAITPRLFHLAMGVLVAMVMAGFTFESAEADSIRSGGFTYNDITVESAENGTLIYTSATGSEVSLPLERIEWIRLAQLPTFGTGEEARLADKPDEAIRQYQQAVQAAGVDWMKKLANWRLLQVATAQNNANVALNAYLQLAQLGDASFMGDQPPLNLVSRLNAQQRSRLATAARRIIPNAQGDLRKNLEQLFNTLQNPAPAPGGTTPGSTPANGTPHAPATDTALQTRPAAGTGNAQSAAQVLASHGLILYERADIPQILKLIGESDFQGAAELTVKSLQDPVNVPEKLYLLGIVQMVMAKQADNPELYKDAAISFMRVPIHYVKNSFRVSCLIEAAYCHLQFGRPDLATKLLDEAEADPEMDEDAYPQYVERIETIRTAIEEQNSAPRNAPAPGSDP